jgi:hypothetical protein
MVRDERPDFRPSPQRVSHVRPHEWIAGHQGVIGKARILTRVRDYQGVVTEDGVRAKGDIARSLYDWEPDPGFEPLPISLDKRNECDRRLENFGRQPRDAVKPFLRLIVQLE